MTERAAVSRKRRKKESRERERQEQSGEGDGVGVGRRGGRWETRGRVTGGRKMHGAKRRGWAFLARGRGGTYKHPQLPWILSSTQ